MSGRSYIIRGGPAGRERLGLLSRVMGPGSAALIARAGIGPGMRCLDVGAGSGDLAFALARIVEPGGSVLGIDFDAAKVSLARAEAERRGIADVTFAEQDVTRGLPPGETFDAIVVRFVLSHLVDPGAVLAACATALRPGGALLLEDVRFAGHVCWPPSPAFDRYVEIYRATGHARGADPEIGPKLAGLARAAGLAPHWVGAHLPLGLDGEAKRLTAVTMELITDAAVAAGVTTAAEAAEVAAALHALADDTSVLASAAQVFQVLARRPG